jgi:hypothetical protein
MTATQKERTRQGIHETIQLLVKEKKYKKQFQNVEYIKRLENHLSKLWGMIEGK